MSGAATGAAAREALARTMNHARFVPGRAHGHYESFFLRANHPHEPKAFWIRYTVFSPRGRPADAIGELWGVYFDGSSGRHHAAKTEVPVERCAFARDRFDVRIGSAWLRDGALAGSAGERQPVSWELAYEPLSDPVFLLPPAAYERGFPRAKSIACAPVASFRGSLRVGAETVQVDGWRGSQNHNWGSRHTDHYAWGQVVGFDGQPDAFLELATARVRMGPVWSPFMTLAVVRVGGREFALNGSWQALRARGRFGFFWWTFASVGEGVRMRGRLSAAPEAFVCLPYRNPPGGVKYCLNSKIAACEVEIEDAGGRNWSLATRHRAAFEILTDDTVRGVPMLADVRKAD